MEDLQRATIADPDDVDSLIGLTHLRTLKVDRDTPEHLEAPRIQALADSLASVEEFLADEPDNIKMRIQRVLLKADMERRRVLQALEGQERSEALQRLYAGHRQELEEIGRLLLGSAEDQLSVEIVTLYSGLERFINSESPRQNTRRLVDRLIEKDTKNAELLWIAARVAEDAGEPEEALGWYQRIEELDPKPVSFAGMRQYDIRRLAQLSKAEPKLGQVMAMGPEVPQEQIDKAMEEVKAFRDEFAASVSDENQRKMMLDGKIARAEGNLEAALRLFKKYNELTERSSPEGLWYEGVVASQLGQFGVARTALGEMIPIDNSQRRLQAMLTLAQIEARLQNYNEAAQLYKDVLVLSPGLEMAVEGLESINRRLRPELNEDPVLAAIYTAIQMRTGTSEIPGDYAGAIQYLREQVRVHDYDPRIARELASLLLDSNDIAGARMVIEQALERSPENRSLSRMAEALESSDPTQVLLEMIRQSEQSELDKLLTISRIASERGRTELFNRTVEELGQIAPDDKRVIEMRFIAALGNGEMEKARSLAEHPELSGLERLTFQARIAVTEQNTGRAMELLEQAIAAGAADASVHSMLARLQRDRGQLNDAIGSFERALEIRPDSSSIIFDYVVTLGQAGRFEQALSTARRLQRYGASDPSFMNLWLNLESVYGGEQGKEFAVKQRERMLELDPTNLDNKFQLARLYLGNNQYEDARVLIDQLRAESDNIDVVELDAAWYAEQGRVNDRDGLALANEIFSDYIASLPQPVGAEPYIANAEFMLARGRPDLAEAAAKNAIEQQSSDTMLGSRLLGDLYMRINNFSEAVKAYREVIDAGADPDNSISARLMEALVRLERYAEAQTVYESLPESFRNGMVTRLQAAEIALGLGQPDRARQLLDQAVASYPNEPLVYVRRAEMMVGDESLLPDLLSDIGRALSLEANNWRAYRVRAAGYFAVGRRDDALQDLRAAIRLNPMLDQSIFAVLNELLAEPGRSGEAIDMAREVIALRPDDATLMSRIAGLFGSHEQWEHAAEMYGKAWDKRKGVNDGAMYIDMIARSDRPDIQAANRVISSLATMVGDINQSPGLLAAQAIVLQASGREDFARQQITKAFDLSVNNDAELLNWSTNLSRLYEDRPVNEHIAYLKALKRRNTNPVIANWLDFFIAQRLLSEDPVPSEGYELVGELQSGSTAQPVRLRAFRQHGSALFSTGGFEQAAHVWRDGLKAFPDDWEMNNNLAYTLSAKLDDPEEALGFGEAAMGQNVTRSEPYETMAGIYTKLGRYEEARQMIEEGSNYLRSVPGRVNMLLTSGRLALAQSDLIEARSKLSDARSVLRSSPEAYESLEESVETLQQQINSAED